MYLFNLYYLFTVMDIFQGWSGRSFLIRRLLEESNKILFSKLFMTSVMK